MDIYFLQILLSKVLYEDWMTFLPEFGADSRFLTHQVDS